MAELPITPRDTSPGVPSSNTPSAPAEQVSDTGHGSQRRAVERKLSAARASLFARLDELGRRVTRARDSVDVARMIRQHPFTAVGIAFSVGLIAGFPRGTGRIGGQVVALATGLAATAARSAISDWLLERIRASSASD
jgi:ElaB/YqjD/DUF883 family membrane-anchored ribosome-binding protein